MKIILAHNNWKVTGGAEFFYQEVARVLIENGHDIAFFSALDDTANTTEWSTYFPETVEYSSGSIIARAANLPKMIYNNNAKLQMARLINDFKPDIIHVFAIYVKLTPSILDAAHEANIPVVMSCNDYKHICPNYKLFHHGHICTDCKGNNFYKAVTNKCCHNSLAYSAASSLEAYVHNTFDLYRKNVHTFLFASEFMALATEEFWGKDKFRWRKLTNPFNAQQFPYSENHDNYILYFGRLIDEKGVNILLDAMATLPDVQLKIIGDGPDFIPLQEQARLLALENVEFTGPKWGEELNHILSRCRFVIVPSIWHENFPYVILQAFAFGKAVIGSNRGGIPELIAHGQRGLVYNADNSQDLASCIKQLWNDASKIVTMGKTAKTFADSTFNDVHFYQELQNIYSEVLS